MSSLCFYEISTQWKSGGEECISNLHFYRNKKISSPTNTISYCRSSSDKNAMFQKSELRIKQSYLKDTRSVILGFYGSELHDNKNILYSCDYT